jgi:hypothetical protein
MPYHLSGVTNAGMIVGSLAIYHDDPTGTSQKLLPQSIQNARNYCVRGVYDDGTWSETPDYWQVLGSVHEKKMY